jgi:hypothetical protein
VPGYPATQFYLTKQTSASTSGKYSGTMARWRQAGPQEIPGSIDLFQWNLTFGSRRAHVRKKKILCSRWRQLPSFKKKPENKRVNSDRNFWGTLYVPKKMVISNEVKIFSFFLNQTWSSIELVSNCLAKKCYPLLEGKRKQIYDEYSVNSACTYSVSSLFVLSKNQWKSFHGEIFLYKYNTWSSLI